MLPEYFVYIGAVISVLGGLSYVVDVLKGRNKPNLVSWSMWSLAPFIAFASQLSQGVGPQAIFTFTAGFNPLLVIAATLFTKSARNKVTKFDILCGGLSLLGLVLWLAADAPNIAILFSIFADLAAAVPTLIKSYKNPESESSLAFFSSSIAATLALLSVKHWDFQHVGFTIYILSICIVLTSLIRFKLGRRIAKLITS